MGPELSDGAEDEASVNASPSRTGGEAGGGRSPWRFAPFALLVAGGVACYTLGLQRYLTLSALVDHSEALSAYVGAYPVRSALTFFSVYVIVVVFSIPAASVLTITAGFLFGCLLGSVIAIAAASLGACLLFVAARGALRDLLRRRAGRFIERLAAGFRRDAFHYLLILRLVPVFPFFIVNIAPAFFDVKLRTFAAATLLGIVPGTFAYAWLGCGLDEVIAHAAAGVRALSPSDFATRHISLALLALALIAALPLVYRRIQLRRREN
ncbi:TVP38/TMEM64 family protein [Sinorhizobium alkalisoli]|uniref:TVP38/TMEM64 family membrane protein n=1 Tax=Sinorhizobium alkalisoli TaxID=1752398 RepID=A0A1E3V9J1_9HYPH|nr:TVP38/TMEM64 family protein [Sinorhizobium alkalisoli]MCG5477463.1 TVP38/TMEM64 family protein [Sinorhizobium alkalisoli]ODR90304.1 mercuric reductase [Sinorhizobium alkalisoli]